MQMSEDLQFVLDNIANVVTGRDSKGLNRKDYTGSFEKYTDEVSPVFNRLQSCIDESPEDRDEIINLVAATLVKEVRDDAADKSKHKGLNARNLAQDEYLIVVVAYMNPCIQKLQLEIGNYFIQAVHAEWIKIWPKQNYKAASEETISGGFKKKWFEFFSK